jgi:hypothetical protein
MLMILLVTSTSGRRVRRHAAASIAKRIFRVHACLHLLGRYQFHIGLEFLIEVAIELFSEGREVEVLRDL